MDLRPTSILVVLFLAGCGQDHSGKQSTNGRELPNERVSKLFTAVFPTMELCRKHLSDYPGSKGGEDEWKLLCEKLKSGDGSIQNVRTKGNCVFFDIRTDALDVGQSFVYSDDENEMLKAIRETTSPRLINFAKLRDRWYWIQYD